MLLQFFLILLTLGANPMVKEYDMVDQSVALDITVNGNNNILFDGTYYWIADHDGTSFLLYRYNNDWTNETLVINDSVTTANAAIIDIIFYYVNATTFHIYWLSDVYAGVGQDNDFCYTKTSDGGANFDAITVKTLIDEYATGLDLFISGATSYISWYNSNTNKMSIAANVVPISVDADAQTGKVTKGWSDGTDYYWICYTGAAYLLRKYTVATSAFSTVETITGLSNGADITFLTGRYWQNGTAKIAAWKNTLNYYISSWKSLLTTSNIYPTPCWKISGGSLTINAFYFDDKYIVLYPNNIVIYSLTNTVAASIGWDLYIIDTSDDLWKLALTTSTRFFQTYCTDEVERAQNCTFRTLTQPIENEFIELYDDSSNLVVKGEAKNVTEENDIYSGRIKTLAENDLDKPITYTSSGAETAATAIGNIITAEFIYITAGTLTSSVTTTTFSYPDKRPAREIITEIAHWDKKLWYLTPAYVLALNAGTIDSTKSFKSSDSKYPANFTHEVNNQQTGTVIGIGPGTVTTTVVKNLANGTLVYYFPNYTQAQMNTAIANIADTEYITQHQYSMNNMFGLLPLQVGTQLTFEYILGSANIPEALMFTKIIQYDVINNYILRLVLHDVLFYRKTSLTPEQVFQYTTTVKTTADAAIPKSAGASNHFVGDVYFDYDIIQKSGYVIKNLGDMYHDVPTGQAHHIRVNSIDIFRIGGSDVVLSKPLYHTNNLAYYWRNAADNAYLECLKLDGSNVLHFGGSVSSANKLHGTSINVRNVADDDYVNINANDFVVSSPKVYEAGLADLLAIDDINDHSQLPAEIKRIVKNNIMRKEIRTESYIDEKTKEEAVRDIEVEVLDHIEEHAAESLGSTVQWLKRALIEEHTEKVVLEQRVQTLELTIKELIKVNNELVAWQKTFLS